MFLREKNRFFFIVLLIVSGLVVSFFQDTFSFGFIDIDTRRRAACDLVRGLCKFFEGPVTGIFSGYVNSMLQEYAKNPSVNWKHKDAAIYLVTSLASKAQTQKVHLFLGVLFLKHIGSHRTQRKDVFLLPQSVELIHSSQCFCRRAECWLTS